MVAHKYNVLPILQIDIITKMVNEGVQTLKFLSSENEKVKTYLCQKLLMYGKVEVNFQWDSI